MRALTLFARLLLLTLVLNIARYFVFGFLEQLVFFDPLFETMEASSEYFRTEFQTIDWVTSYLYNFIMWFIVVCAFHFVHPHLTGHMVVKSLKVFGLFLVCFLCISAIYMNHYSHPKDFYAWNMVDAAIIFPLMGLANGLAYPLFRIQPRTSSPETSGIPSV